MENIVLNSSLFEAEENLNKTLSFLRWQGIEASSFKKSLWGYESVVVFNDQELIIFEAIDGYDLKKVLSLDSSFLNFKGYKNETLLKSLGVETVEIPEVFKEYEILKNYSKLFPFDICKKVDFSLGLLTDLGGQSIDKKAYCIFQFLKKEEIFLEFLNMDLSSVDSKAVAMAMESRRMYLDYRPGQDPRKIKYVDLSSLAGVNKILATEMISQYKNVLKSSKDSAEMRTFYKTWLRKLAPYYQFKVKIREVLSD